MRKYYWNTKRAGGHRRPLVLLTRGKARAANEELDTDKHRWTRIVTNLFFLICTIRIVFVKQWNTPKEAKKLATDEPG